MHLKYTYLLILSLLLFTKSEDSIRLEAISLLTTQKKFTAGETIVLEFLITKNNKKTMYCSNSYGSTLLQPILKNNRLYYTIPKYISNKIGIISWKILSEKPVFGTFEIVPNTNPVSMESYLGPPSIEAGGTDFTMLVVIPTDSIDNPIKNTTEVSIQTQFLSKENTSQVFTKNLISYKNIFSPIKSGRMLLSSVCLGLDSKEYDVNIMPAIPKNFKIYVDRNHQYADGNQMTTFYTSVLKDNYGNIVSDGSFVDFFITNKNGSILKTSGATIKGIASTKIIHPDFEDQWSVKAYVVGIAESNVLTIAYKKAIENYEVVFSENNRELKIGPLKSFMNQVIPDGLQVKLSIYREKKFIQELLKTSSGGYVYFKLDKNIFADGIYNFKINTAGIKKTFQSKKLW